MGKKMDLNGLNDQECARIYEVIQRDSMLRTREQQRLSKIEDELNSEAAKRNILANQKAFNDKYCILCCSAFNFLFNKKLICRVCKFNVCRNCAFFEEKLWICRVCEKQRFLYLQSCKWQCNKDGKIDSNVHFGSAKLFEGFINHCKIYNSGKSDSFDDSIMKSNMNGNCDLSQTNDEEKASDRLDNSGQNTDSSQTLEDSTLIEVREHIEAMVEGFLGESLDSAHVDKPYDDMQYEDFLNNHKERLSHALMDLTQALYLTMTNKPTINTPTNAHVMLKDLIIKITQDSYHLPYLTKKYSSNNSTEETFDHLYNFNSYEELLATAIINQLIEVRQSQYSENSNESGIVQDSESENLKSTKYSEISIESDLADCESVFSSNDPSIVITGTSIDSKHSLVDSFISQQPSYVLKEQIEEITTTKSYSDAEEMPYNEESMPYPELNLNVKQTPLKVPFPEAGVDIVDVNMSSSAFNDEDLSEDSGIKLTDLQNWEENWLFKKKKRVNNKSDIMYGYMALTMAERPVSMLIPNPSHKVNTTIGMKEIDELSELSEHNSVGSLEFSDDESEAENETELYQNRVIINLDSQTTNKSSDTNTSELNATKSKIMRNKTIAIAKLPTEVPNFLPIELRNSVVQSGSEPCFVLRPGDASVQSGIIVQFCCRAKGTKPILFAWFKNDILLNTDDNIRIFQSGEENILEIKKTKIEDSAQYSCVAYNHFGNQWCDFSFKVRDSSFSSNKLSNINKRTRKQNMEVKSKHEIMSVSSESTYNSKHDKYDKSHPLVIQRTWSERVAELQNISLESKYQDNEEMPPKRGKSDEQSNEQNVLCIPTLISGTIAEREHKKWESPDIEWKDNPYTTEKINSRIQQRALNASLGIESSPELKETTDEEHDPAFFSYNKDLNRYKREYYIPENYNKEETLKSYDENEYSNTKYVDINLSKHPIIKEERNSEIKINSSEASVEVEVEVPKASTAKNSIETEPNSSDSESFLPSVKELVNKFSSNSVENDLPQRLENGKRDSLTESNENISNLPKKASPRMNQISQSTFKVHSLTARSMSREFRELSHLNIPRRQNRIGINANNPTIVPLESEPSSPSTACSPTNEGYASDESNTSSGLSNNGNLSVAIQQNKTNNGRKFSRSILKRANYWEKRCEQGLISDSSVNEDFPPIEGDLED